MERPEFTKEQEDWICNMIGEWYLHWKSKLVNYEEKTHKLGFAKEHLKALLCDEIDQMLDDLFSLANNAIKDENHES